ncbi:putative GTP-binding protein 6-like protein [Leptotrombidium deliense]|uniref:Putative GTP-binding protein 6-like protein n=1 Tax=Leptotrombidium deliense TaxID=299467 RepID=A0A443SI94_9ACAR|nr:putative GTP-binding protein 6-like protein [Leptotrombidium deliense]
MNARVFSVFARRICVFSKHLLQNRHCSQGRRTTAIEDEIKEILDDDEGFENVRKQISNYGWSLENRNVFVVQPRVKYGPERFAFDRDYLLQETIALIETLPNWKVCGFSVVPTIGLKKKALFGSGNLEKLRAEIFNSNCNTVVLSTDLLTAMQQSFLEECLAVPVCDRYSIVLQIFKDHAKTKEAKLQVALAEIPYIRSKLRDLHIKSSTSDNPLINAVGGSKEKLYDDRKKILRDREGFIRKCLDKLSSQREINKEQRIRLEIPSVAIVGYTNAGKTSLIKNITNDARLEPQDYLFATLDVTAHMARLPQGQKTLLLDTVGFISNIPIELVHAFNSTLNDVVASDLIVHVYDVSHPNVEEQRKTVMNTLKSIGVSEKLMSSIVEVGNKIDLVESEKLSEKEHFYISAKKSTNIFSLKEEMERRLYVNTNRFMRTLRVLNGGELYQWLWSNITLASITADAEDSNFAVVEAYFTEASFAKFLKLANKKVG